MYMLILTIVLQQNLGIDSLLPIHHILGKLNFILHLARRALKSHQCGQRPKKFGDPWTTSSRLNETKVQFRRQNLQSQQTEIEVISSCRKQRATRV